MSNNMNLREMLEETDALTYVNAIKVTLTEIKAEANTQDQLKEYMAQSCERTKKLLRRADGQYRILAKIVTREAPVANNIVVAEASDDEKTYREVMESNG